MIIEREIPPWLDWLLGTGKAQSSALLNWLLVIGTVFLLGVALAVILGICYHGPARGVRRTFHRLWEGILDLVRFSPRRTLAMTRLALHEAVRRRVLVAFLLFSVILLFGGWFLDPTTRKPAKLYLDFVLSATSYLVLAVAVVLSAMSLPTDIARRTIYTVVTKPVRPVEIVLGRVLGFAAIGTLLLLLNGFASYIFVVRALDHRHEVNVDSLSKELVLSDAGDREVLRGETTSAFNHRHRVEIDIKTGQGRTDLQQEHWHQVQRETSGGEEVYVVGPPEGMLVARIVHLADEFHFLDRRGRPTNKGLNVGNQWTYRGYIEGGSKMAARWLFRGVSADRYPRGLPVEMTLSVFRAFKGDIERGILGSLVLENPKTGMRSVPINFISREYTVYQHLIPRSLQAYDPQTPDLKLNVDLFSDLVADGELIIELQCLEARQYFGVAKADLYFKMTNGSFRINFLKGLYSIWLQMFLMVAAGVTFSTFLNASVALLSAAAYALGGLFSQHILHLATASEVVGGRSFEAAYRLITHTPIATPLQETPVVSLVRTLDAGMQGVYWVVAHILPDIPGLSNTHWVTSGYDIPANSLVVKTFIVLGFVVPLVVVAHFILKARELAK